MKKHKGLKYGDCLFRTENGINEIYEGSYRGAPCYIVRHVPKDFVAVIDHNAALVDSIIKKILRTGHPIAYSMEMTGKHVLRFYKGGREKAIALRLYVFAKYRGLTLNAVRGRNICSFDDSGAAYGLRDLRSCNLYDAGDIRPHTAARDIEIIQRPGTAEKYILITLHSKGGDVQEYTNYEPELYEILSRPSYCSIRLNGENGRSTAGIHFERSKNGYKIENIARLILLYKLHFSEYKWKSRAVMRFMRDYQKISKRHDGQEAGHINACSWNNCFDNLVFMDRKTNNSMKDYIKWFSGRYRAYTAANSGGEILVELSNVGFFRCRTPEDYHDWQFVFLGKRLTGKLQELTYKEADGIHQELTPRGMIKAGAVNKETAKTNEPDIWDWMEHRDKLLVMDASNADAFFDWKAGAGRTICGVSLPDDPASGQSFVVPWGAGFAMITPTGKTRKKSKGGGGASA